MMPPVYSRLICAAGRDVKRGDGLCQLAAAARTIIVKILRYYSSTSHVPTPLLCLLLVAEVAY